ncbi:hypothetical protein ACA758_04575 [Mycoplasmopsis agassizii]|uniref:hypothetical protein n=1 Tax=Mycoplasmopsis agassizii TaxID=33922 RepID=UPI00352746E2
MFVVVPVSVTSVIATISCTTIKDDNKDQQKIQEAANIFDKLTDDNRPYLQINTWNYMDYTFSDFYWTFEGFWKNNNNDSKNQSPDDKLYPAVKSDDDLRADRFVKKRDWDYGTRDSIENHGFIFRNFSEQKDYPSYLKSISLVRNQDELKQALRLDQKGKEKYLQYYKKLESTRYNDNPNLSDQKLEGKYSPWSNDFNFDTINAKFDFKKNDYIFLKDLRSAFGNDSLGIVDLNKGIKIGSYKIDADSKKLEINFSYDEETQHCHNCDLDDMFHTWDWKRLSSMFIPMEKGKINNFDMNDWQLKLKGYYYIPFDKR